MATKWLPYTPENNHQYLLTNGDVIDVPPMERTESGRKYRVPSTGADGFAKDVPGLLFGAVQAEAAKRGTNPWMRIDRADPVDSAPTMEFLNPRSYNHHLRLWWRYRHPTFPIEALFAVDVTRRYSQSPRRIKTTLQVPNTDPAAADPTSSATACTTESSVLFKQLRLQLTRAGRTAEVDAFDDLLVGAAPVQVPLNEWEAPNDRETVKELLALIRRVEDQASVLVPDLRDSADYHWMLLDAVDSNVTHEFISGLRDYLESGPLVAELAEAYDKVLEILRRLGINTTANSGNEFLASALAKDEPIQMAFKPYGPDGTEDSTHTLTVHLLTGTFAVSCSHRAASNDKDKVALDWETAQVKAMLTGHEDELLAYAREYARRQERVKYTELIERRRA